MKYLAIKICQFVCKYCPISDEEKKLVEYGSWIIFDTALKYICMICIATFFLDFLSACILAVGFALLRVKAGGYHAKTSFMCGFWMLMIQTVSAIIGHYYILSVKTTLCIELFLCLLFYILLVERGNIEKKTIIEVLLIIVLLSGISVFYLQVRTAMVIMIVLDAITVIISHKEKSGSVS